MHESLPLVLLLVEVLAVVSEAVPVAVLVVLVPVVLSLVQTLDPAVSVLLV